MGDSAYSLKRKMNILRSTPLRRFCVTSPKRIDLDKVYTVLVEQGAIDICCIKVPERNYCEYFIVCGTRSAGQLRNIPINLAELAIQEGYRKPVIEGISKGFESTDWTSIALDNTVVHIMTPDARQRYDLETLWALGEKYDSKMNFDQADLDLLSGLIKEEDNFDWNYFKK